MKWINVFFAIACLMFSLVPFSICTAAVRINGALFGPSVPEPFSVNSGNSFSSVFIDEKSSVDVRGGTIINIDQTFSRDTLRLMDDARVNVSGGLVQMKTRSGVTFGSSALFLEDRSEATITGGRLEAFGGSDKVIDLSDQSSATIRGGEFIGHSNNVIHKFSTGRLSIYGGIFTTISPSNIDLDARTGVTNIHALSATLDGQAIGFGPINAGSGTHTLGIIFGDGTRENLTFRQRGGQMNLFKIPEPASNVMALCFAWTLRGRRQRKATY